MQNYYPDLNIDIKDIQRIQLEILLEFANICENHGIKYQLFGGTLLGAIRHGGFIPWDDDIDVALLRKDYNKFIKVAKKELNTKYFLQTHITDRNYINHYAKIRKNNTKFVEKDTSECEIHHGIYIDVFPLDNISPESILGNLQQKGLYTLRLISLSRIKMITKNAKTFMRRTLSLLLHYLLKIIPREINNFLQEKLLIMFRDKRVKYATHLTNGASKRAYDRFMIEKEKFNDTIEWEFEGYKFPIPKDYDNVLTNLYGDYMCPPPKEKQKPHHGIIEVNFRYKN